MERGRAQSCGVKNNVCVNILWHLFRGYIDSLTAYLTAVTLQVEVFVEGHHSDRFLAPWGWNNGFIAAHTQRRETSKRRRQNSVVISLKFSKVKQHKTLIEPKQTLF